MATRALTVLLLMANTLPALTSTWTGAGDGTDWFDPTNWDNGVPTTGDSAIFDASADGFTINFDAGNVLIEDLTFQFAVETGPFLTGDSDFTVNNYFYAMGGGILATTPNHLFTINSGYFDLDGTLGFTFQNRIVENFAGMSILGTNQLVLDNSTILNYDVLDFENGGSGFNAGNGVLENIGGTLIKSGAAPEVAIGWDVSNDGLVGSSSGNFHFTGNFTQDSGSLVLDNGAQITLSGSTNINGGDILGNGMIMNNTGNTLDLINLLIDPMGNAEDVIVNDAPPTPGTLQFHGNFSFDANTVFFLDIHGATTGTYDRVEFISGMADMLDGPQLYLYGDSSIISSITGADVLTILSGDYVGEFFNAPDGSLMYVYDLDTFNPLGTFEIDYLTNSIHLINFTPVPEPRTWALIGLGAALIGCWAWKRRR